MFYITKGKLTKLASPIHPSSEYLLPCNRRIALDKMYGLWA